MESLDSVLSQHTNHRYPYSLKRKPQCHPESKNAMVVQDVGYELVYEPGKDEADPLDYLSRHPLPEIGDDSNEKIIR